MSSGKCIFEKDFDLNFIKQNEGIINGGLKFLLFTNDTTTDFYGKQGKQITLDENTNFDDLFDVSVSYDENSLKLICDINSNEILSSYTFKGIKIFGSNYFIDKNAKQDFEEKEISLICTEFFKDPGVNFSELSEKTVYETLLTIDFDDFSKYDFSVSINDYENKVLKARNVDESFDTYTAPNLYMNNAILNVNGSDSAKINIQHNDSNVSICYDDENKLSFVDNDNKQPNIEIFGNDNFIQNGVSGYVNIYSNNNSLSGNDNFLFNSHSNSAYNGNVSLFNSTKNRFGSLDQDRKTISHSGDGLLINSNNNIIREHNNIMFNSFNNNVLGNRNVLFNSNAVTLVSGDNNFVLGNNISLSSSKNNIIVGNQLSAKDLKNSLFIGTSANKDEYSYISANENGIVFDKRYKNDNKIYWNQVDINAGGISFKSDSKTIDSKTPFSSNTKTFQNFSEQLEILKKIGNTELLHSKFIDLDSNLTNLNSIVEPNNILNNTIITFYNKTTDPIKVGGRDTISKEQTIQFLYINKRFYKIK